VSAPNGERTLLLDPDPMPTATKPGLSNPDTSGIARDIVRSTRRTSRQHNRAHSSVRDLLVDIYSNMLAAGCVAMLAVSFVVALREEIAQRDLLAGVLVDTRWQVLPADLLWVFLTYVALVRIAGVARRFGPISVSGAEGAWWLPLPIDRRPMLLPSFRRRLIAVGVIGTLAYLPFTVLTAIEKSPWTHASSAMTFGAGAVIAVISAAVLQLADASRALRAATFVGLIPVAVLPFLAPAVLPFVLSLVGAAVLAVYVFPRLGDIPQAELVRGGAVSGHAGASIFFLDVNELRRALGSGTQSVTSSRARGFYAKPTLNAFAAIVRADVVAFLRLQPLPVGPLLWLGICVAVVLITPAMPVLLQVGVIVTAGCATTAATGAVARRIAVVPQLDELLPVHPVLVRCSRMLMPGLSMAAWMGLLMAAFVVLGAAGPPLILLGVLAGPGMGAGAVRAATRPSPDWATPPVETPFGPVPRNQASSLLRGTDTTILAISPVAFALYLGAVHPGLILAQCAASAIAIAVQALTSPGRTIRT
jgi:hypothetical protein